MNADEFLKSLKSKKHPWYWHLYHRIRHKISDIRFDVRVRFNRAVHGYDEFDWWEYASQNSTRAVKLLTILRDLGHGIWPGVSPVPSLGQSIQGVSLDGSGREGTKAILDDMIFFHTVVASLPMPGQDKYYEFYDLSPADKHRYRRGKYYYFRYYESLWD